MDNKKLWDSVLVEMELNVSKANFNTWFKDTFVSKYDDGTVYLGVPNAFVKDWLHNKYHSFILKSLRGLSEGVRSLEYTIARAGDKAKVEKKTVTEKVNELPLQDLYVNSEDNLNPKYTFDTFVVGPFNELAHAASQAVVKNPGSVYNPLFIYGNTGHGKTHLIQAIGNQMKVLYPEKKIYYATSERFANDYINAVQAGSQKVNQFKEKYRKYDVLIMDDIHFLSSKEKTQEEFFHLFNNLHDSNKHIILSSDRHVNYTPELQDRLKSRFMAGMIIDIPAPDFDSRMAILKAKARINNFTLAPDVIEYLAHTSQSNVRELEGILNLIICQSNLKERDLNVMEVKNLIKTSSKPKKNMSPKDIIKVIADFYNIGEGSIYEKTRKKEVIKPRQIIMYILREEFNISYPSIGEKMGGRDHTTVIHSCEKIKNDMREDPTLVQELNQIKAMIM